VQRGDAWGYSFTDLNGQIISIGPEFPTWELSWNLATFALSGSFEGETQWSPWVPDAGHFTISQGDFHVGIPSSETFNPIPYFTFSKSTGHVVFSGGPCAVDSFFPPQPELHCSGLSYGSPASIDGTFDGKTLDIQGSTGGVYNPVVFIKTYVGLTPPPSVDPSLFPQSQPYGYRIVANVVPEPDTISLVLVGIAAAYQASNRRRLKRKI